MTENELAKLVIDLSMDIHSQTGPGLFESVYEELLATELEDHKINFQRQVSVPIIYKGRKLQQCFRADLIVENKLLIELKSVEALSNLYYRQLLTYLKLTNLKLGLLINFDTVLLKHGIKRIVNGLQEE